MFRTINATALLKTQVFKSNNNIIQKSQSVFAKTHQCKTQGVRFASFSSGRKGGINWENKKSSPLTEESLRKIAEEEVRETERLGSLAFGGDPYQVARSLNDVGLVYFTQNRLVKAKPFLLRALDMAKNQTPNNVMFISTCLKNVASYYIQLKEYDTAIKYLEENLERCRKQNQSMVFLNPDQAKLLEALESLTNVYLLAHRYDSAFVMCLECIQLSRQIHGKDDPVVANHLSTLGAIYQSIGQYEDSERCHQEAMEIYKKHFGANHLSVASSKSQIGLLKLKAKDYERSVQFLKDSLNIHEKVWAPINGEHPSVAKTYHDLYLAYKDSEQLSKAKRCLIKEMDLVERIIKASVEDVPTEEQRLLSQQQQQQSQVNNNNTIMKEEQQRDNNNNNNKQESKVHPKIASLKQELEQIRALERMKKQQKSTTATKQ